jgi:hypothetical protein
LFADLHELNTIPKVIHHGLESPKIPPLNRVVVLAASYNNPIRQVNSELFCDGGGPGSVFSGEMDIGMKRGQPHACSQSLVQILDEAPKEMERHTVGLMDQWIMTIDAADVRILLAYGRKIWVMGPEIGARRANVSAELAGMAAMQITNGGGEH